jgi:hypothetical protein
VSFLSFFSTASDFCIGVNGMCVCLEQFLQDDNCVVSSCWCMVFMFFVWLSVDFVSLVSTCNSAFCNDVDVVYFGRGRDLICSIF